MGLQASKISAGLYGTVPASEVDENVPNQAQAFLSSPRRHEHRGVTGVPAASLAADASTDRHSTSVKSQRGFRVVPASCATSFVEAAHDDF